MVSVRLHWAERSDFGYFAVFETRSRCVTQVSFERNGALAALEHASMLPSFQNANITGWTNLRGFLF